MMDIESIKAANPIQEVINEAGLTLTGLSRGRYWRTKEHDSLVIDTEANLFYWNSRGLRGDVITWLQQQKGMSFGQAVAHLARRAGLEYEPPAQSVAAWAEARARHDLLTDAALFFKRILEDSTQALEYAHGRGWSDETIDLACLGFWDGDRKALRSHLKVTGHDAETELAKALFSIPANMVIYPHMRGGRCTYLSARSIKEKRHWNLPAALAGPRRPYFNYLYHGQSGHVVMVEGQADALSLAQWDIAAVALAGTAADEQLLGYLRRHRALYLALDRDDAGAAAIEKLIDEAGPMTRIVTWPEGIGDANEWLQAGATVEEARELVGNAPSVIDHLVAAHQAAGPMDKSAAFKRVVEMAARLSQYDYSLKRSSIREGLGLQRVTDLDAAVKAIKKKRQKQEEDDRPTVRRIGGFSEGHLFETIYTNEPGAGPVTRLVVRFPDGEIRTLDRLELEREIIEPLRPDDQLLATRAMVLAPNARPYDSLAELVANLKAFLHDYVDIEPGFEAISAFYALYTWVYDLFPRAPYLRRVGDYAGGKSRWLSCMKALAFRATYQVGFSSTAALFRLADEYKGTILIDEADIKRDNSDHTRVTLALINSGYDKHGVVTRMVQRGSSTDLVVQPFSVYGPKCFTMREPFPDEATNSRCLTDHVSAGGFVREGIPLMLDDAFWRRADELRAQLLWYRLKTWRPHVAVDERFADPKLPARLQEIILPLRILFAEASPELMKELDELVTRQHAEFLADRAGSLSAKHLQGVLRAWILPTDDAGAGLERLQMKWIAHHINYAIDQDNEDVAAAGADEPEPEEGEEGGKPKRRRRRKKGSVTHHHLPKRLKEMFGLSTQAINRGKMICLVWDEKRINELCSRYGLEEYKRELEEEAERRKKYGPMA